MPTRLAFSVTYRRGNQGAKGKGICCRSVLENGEILGVWSSWDFWRGEARGQQSLQCLGTCRALTPDGHLALALLCSPGSAGSFEEDHRPSLKKEFLNWLKDREQKTTSRASSLSSFLSSAGVAFEVIAQTYLRYG